MSCGCHYATLAHQNSLNARTKTHADGIAADCVRCGHTFPVVRVYVYGPDGGGPDIVNVFDVGYGQPWPGGWRMPAGDVEALSNCFDRVVEAGPGWAGASRIELHLDGGPHGTHSIVVDDA